MPAIDDDAAWMLICEARYWISRGQAMPAGKAAAWWVEQAATIKQHRGQAGLDALLAEMDRQASKK